MITLERHARYALPDGTLVMARCWETGIAPPQWKLHSDDSRSLPLYCIDNETIMRYVYDDNQNTFELAITDLVFEDLAPVG